MRASAVRLIERFLRTKTRETLRKVQNAGNPCEPKRTPRLSVPMGAPIRDR